MPASGCVAGDSERLRSSGVCAAVLSVVGSAGDLGWRDGLAGCASVR